MSHFRSILIATVSAAFAVGCGGSDSPSAPGGNGGGGGGGGGTTREIKANPSFAMDIQEIFARNGCTASGCHGDGTGAGLMLGSSAAANHGTLVNVPSTQSNFNRVTPNDATNSYLVIKLEGRQSVGQRMPRGGGSLDNIDLTNIRNWINTGALNN